MEEQDFIKEISLPIYQSKGWLKLLGVVMIIMGIFTAFTIFGIIICWLPIWLGVLLFQAAGAIDGAQFNGNKEQLVKSLSKIKLYFMINGILMLIFIIIAAIMLLISGGAMLNLMSNM